MLRRFFLIFTLLCLPAAWSQAQVASKPQGKKLDLSFVPDDAVAALVAHPRRVLTSPQAALWPTEIFTALGKREAGFDPLEVEQVIGVVGMGQMALGGGFAPQGEPVLVGIALRFRNQADGDAIGQKIAPRGIDDKIAGRRARIAQAPSLPSVAFPDERTVLIGSQGSLAWMLAAKPGDGPLHKLLQAADGSSDAAAFLAIEPLRPMLAGVLPMLQQFLPQMFQEALDLPMTVETAQLKVNLSNDGSSGLDLELKLGAANPQTAENAAAVIKNTLKESQAYIMTQISDGMDDGDSEDLEIKVASMKYVQRLSDALLTALDPKPVGNQVTMNADLKVGVAEIGMLTGLMLPAVHGARDAARRAQSQNNLKQIALSFHNHHDMKKTFPATANYDANGKPLLSWRVHMLPLLEENQLYQQFHLDEPWDSEHNKKLVEQMPAVYKHPKFDQPGKTVYLAVVGKGAAFEGKEGQKIRTFTDGTSKTIMVVEVTPEKAVPWTKPEDWEFDAENQIDMNDFGGLSAGDIFNAVFADGHVQALTRSIDPEAFKTMLTRNGGEVIPLP